MAKCVLEEETQETELTTLAMMDSDLSVWHGESVGTMENGQERLLHAEVGAQIFALSIVIQITFRFDCRCLADYTHYLILFVCN